MNLQPAKEIRSDGYSLKVINSGEPCFIPDTLSPNLSIPINPHMVDRGTKAAACIPLGLRRSQNGVLWIEFREKHTFSKIEEHALKLYATQAGIAYENAQRMQELEQLRIAADAMAKAELPKDVLQVIAKSARKMLDGDYSLIWSYDEFHNIFIPEEMVADEIPEDWLEKFRLKEPQAGKTARHILQKGYVHVSNLAEAEVEYLGELTKAFMKEFEVTSFQSTPLKVAGEPLGVLFVDYKDIRSFGKEEKRILEHFADLAASTLKRARLLAQVTQAREAARIVAQVSTLGNLTDTLNTIVEGACSVLHSDIVTLYTFSEVSQRFVHVTGIGLERLQQFAATGGCCQ